MTSQEVFRSVESVDNRLYESSTIFI